jgi:2-hydroxy-6-oxonona-2,4-dienedioate hydrolase
MRATEIDFTYRHLPNSGTPVVLLPGLVGSDWIWRSTVECLSSAGHSTLVWNTPIALLDRDAATSIDVLRESVLDLLDHMSVERALLCGNSLGALLALDFASHHPERSAGLIVSGSPGMHEGIIDLDYLLEHTDRETLQHYAQRLFYSRPETLDPELVEQTIEMVLHRPTALNILRAFQATRSHDTVGILPRISCPVSLVWGEHDLVTPLENWRAHIPSIPAAELHVIDACGHAPMIEQPEAWLGLLLAFVERLLGRPGATKESPAVDTVRHASAPAAGTGA